MISRSGNKNFFAAHYEFVALAIGALALMAGVAFYVMSLGVDPDESAADSVAEVERMKPSKTGVKPVDMTALQSATKVTRSPVVVGEVVETSENFLASERRVLCKCKKAISGNVKLVPVCPYCGERQEEEKKIVLDADGDGLPDEWEKQYGLNPNNPNDADEDADGDGFTNAEEFAAKTDPTNKLDHPDYLDSLKLTLPLKETYVPFLFTKATKIPAGWRCEFFDAKQKDDYGRSGRTFTALVGEEIGNSGYVLKTHEKKEAKRAIKGGGGMTRTVDASEVTVQRKRDGKELTIVVAENKRTKLTPVDVQATLVYERNGTKNIDVVPGSEITLNECKYLVTAITAVGKGAKVTIETVGTKKKRVLEALEQ